MRFDRIRLQNFKCYEETDVRLDRGVTVIHGLNGSGKSSLLEACFFALYGSKALNKNLDEIVTIGAEETIVELDFTHAGESYNIRRRIRVSGGDARTAECVMEGPETTTEGATDVRERIANLLRMDTDAFVNCAYVRQGEVNKLINASPSDRQDMIDDLLQLGKLEQYRERASDARVGVGRVRDDKQGALNEIEEQIEAKEAKELHETRNSLRSKLGDIDEQIDDYEQNKQRAENTRDQAESIIEEHQEKQAELGEIKADIETLREKIEATERTREQLAEDLDTKRQKRREAEEDRDNLIHSLDGIETSPDGIDAETVEAELDEIQEEIDDLTEQIREKSVEKQEYDGKAENHREQAAQLEAEAEEAREQATQLESELEEAETSLDQKRDELSEKVQEAENKRNSFEDAPIEFGDATNYHDSATEELTALRETRAEQEATLENARERLVEAEELLDAGKCPECGQPLEDSPHVDAIDEYRERVSELEAELESLDERAGELEEKKQRAETLLEREGAVEKLEREQANVRQLLDERERNLEEKRERIEQLRAEATEADDEAAEKRDTATEADELATECQETIAAYNREKATLSAKRDQLESLADTLDELAELTAAIERIREQRAEKEEVNDERRERLAEKRERRNELSEEFDQKRVQKARNERENAVEYLENVTAELDRLNEKKTEHQERLGAVENELEQLEELRTRREELSETVEKLESLHSEAADLEEMYGHLRAQLRRQNVESLERMLNETFDLVYENDTYSRIKLDGEYRLTVYQKDGEELDPEQLSGGERALFNLSLRCAIYRLLAEGIEGTAPMPPLILDEPTVFLDSGHVTQLVELVESMRDRGVEQILVVSHDDELVGAADELITVKKDSTTNRSTVERGTLDAQALEAGGVPTQ